MGTACVPSGKRFSLPKKRSTIWLLLKAVIGLLTETTATTSARAEPLAKANPTPIKERPMRFMATAKASEHEIDRNAEQVDGTAGAKTGLRIYQRALRTRAQAHMVELQLEIQVFGEVPA